MIYTIYCYTNKINLKKYIGLTKRTIEARRKSHIYESQNKSNSCYNTPFKRAIRKYGIDNFDLEILDTAKTLEEACKKEKYYIKTLKTYYKYSNSNGYNATIGGEFLVQPKDKVISICLDDLNSITTYESVACAERILNARIYESVGKFNRSAKNCIWIYEKDFNINTYKDNIMKNQNFVCQVSKNNELINIFRNSSTAANSLNISQGNISMCCNGNRVSCSGYYWCFYEDYVNKNFPKRFKKKLGKEVLRFDKYGKLIDKFQTATEASIKTGINISDISTSCNNLDKLAGGFIWRYAINYKGENITYKNKNCTAVYKLDDNFNKIDSFEKIIDAAKNVDVKYSGISRAIKKGIKSGGFYWQKA